MGARFELIGFFRWPLLLSFFLVVLLGLWSASKLFRPGASADPKTRVWVDATLFWGVFALISGVLGSLMGVIRALQGFERAGQFGSPLVAQGVVALIISLVLGVAILGVAALLWFFLQLRWRLLNLRVMELKQ